MKNPWPQLPTNSVPCVLREDRAIIQGFNARYGDDPDFRIQQQLLPEPFIGDRHARVYLLNLNPGYSAGEDDAWHGDRDYRTAIIDSLSHRTSTFPFYFFDPRLKDAPGSKWWRERARWLIDDIGIQTLAENLFCVELFPYHSKEYKPVPKALSANGLVPSSAYGVHLVRRAIQANRPIVAMRAFSKWRKLLPELEAYGKLFRLKSPRSVWLSPRNLDGYDRLVGELRAATGD